MSAIRKLRRKLATPKPNATSLRWLNQAVLGGPPKPVGAKSCAEYLKARNAYAERRLDERCEHESEGRRIESAYAKGLGLTVHQLRTKRRKS